jgi:hypothetical protein
MTSIRWFIDDHAADLPPDLRSALCGPKRETKISNQELITRLEELSDEDLGKLCSAIEATLRSYFGTFSRDELIACLKDRCGC